MSGERDLAEGRLFCYVASLWTMAAVLLILALEIATAVGVDLAGTRAFIAYLFVASGGLLVAGMYYERVINQIGRAIARIWPSAGVQDGESA